MFVPINTDAPLYHFPRGTIFLIVANVICFVLTGFGYSSSINTFWMLQYGNGINPLEWLTSMFAHGDWSHLVGNMFFLWGFGLVVEGKLGWRRFVPLYLAMGLMDGCACDLLTLYRTDEWAIQNVFGMENRAELEQTLAEEADITDAAQVDELLLAAKGGCLGASSVIFALMAISLVWAPKNELQFVGLVFMHAVSFDITIMMFSFFYIGLTFLLATIEQFGPDSSTLHLLGIVQGLIVGTVYHFRGWVDCENWDLFAVLAGTHGRKNSEIEIGAHAKLEKDYSKPTQDAAQPDASQPVSTGDLIPPAPVPKKLKPIVDRIQSGDFIGASEAMFELRLKDSTSYLDPENLRKLSLGLLMAGVPDEAEIYIDEYLERFSEETAWARIRKAEILVDYRQRPAAALALLKSLKSSEVTEQQKSMARGIAAKATQQIRSGVEDAEPEW